VHVRLTKAAVTTHAITGLDRLGRDGQTEMARVAILPTIDHGGRGTPTGWVLRSYGPTVQDWNGVMV